MHLCDWEVAQVFLWCSSSMLSTQETDPSDSSAFHVKCCSFSSPSCRAHRDIAGFKGRSQWKRKVSWCRNLRYHERN